MLATLLLLARVDPLAVQKASASRREWAQEQVAATPAYLAGSGDNRAAVALVGAIEPLVALLQSGSAEAQERAASALINLAASADNRETITQAGAIEPLVALLRSGSALAQGPAAAALANLASGNAANQAAIARAGAIEPLVALVRDGSGNAATSALHALYSLASSADTLAAFAQPGNLKHLIARTRAGSAGSEQAAGLLKVLAAKSVEIRMAINREGGIGPSDEGLQPQPVVDGAFTWIVHDFNPALVQQDLFSHVFRSEPCQRKWCAVATV